MKQNIIKYAVTAFVLLLPLTAFAELTLTVKAEKEIAVMKNGKKELKRVKAKSFEPDNTIFYTISYKNNGTEVVNNAIIDDPIPRSTRYIPDSASGEGADITFSIDNGKSYKKPLLLTYEIKGRSGEIRQATPEEYTNIRWIVQKIEPGASGKVEFSVKVN